MSSSVGVPGRWMAVVSGGVWSSCKGVSWRSEFSSNDKPGFANGSL